MVSMDNFSNKITLKNLFKYIGIPFVDKGDSFDGIDCWHLIKLFYKNELGIELNDYYISALDTESINKALTDEKEKSKQNLNEWIEIDKPEPYCLVLINLMNDKNIFCDHIGVCIDNTYFLHAYAKTGSCLGRFSRWKSHIKGFYKLNRSWYDLKER